MAKKKRDYKAEYRRRIQRGRSKGLSRSQARGHPGKGEKYASQHKATNRYDRKLEEGLKGMRSGKSLTKAAKSAHVSPERLRRYAADTGVAEKERNRWRVLHDNRPREVQVYSGGRAYEIMVPGYEPAKLVGRHVAAVKEFFRTNNVANLAPFRGEWVDDIHGRRHVFETRPNVLYRMYASGIESFEQVYKIVS